MKGRVLPMHQGIKLVEQDEHPMEGPGDWYEVSEKKANLSALVINDGCPELPIGPPNYGVNSNTSTVPVRFLGFTSKTSEQVYIFIREYKIAYPTYTGGWNDCRTFVDALTKFLL